MNPLSATRPWLYHEVLMMPDPNVIRAIEAAVSADPSNLALRIHLSELLIEAERPVDALEQIEEVLRIQPDHLDALRLAAKSGTMVGDVRSTGWLRLYESLSGPAVQPSTQALNSESGGDLSPGADDLVAAEPDDKRAGDADWDGFLQDVLRDAGGRAQSR